MTEDKPTTKKAKKTRTIVILPEIYTNDEGESVEIAELGIIDLVKAKEQVKQNIDLIEESRAHAAELAKRLPNFELILRAINQQIRNLTK